MIRVCVSKGQNDGVSLVPMYVLMAQRARVKPPFLAGYWTSGDTYDTLWHLNIAIWKLQHFRRIIELN